MEMEHSSLISELNQGRELAIQLISHLQPCSSSQETCVLLSEQIHSSFEKALSKLNWGALMADSKPQNHKIKTQKDMLKKRKLLPRWTEEVKACSGTGLEGPLNDGYSWRKYGQKDIHGATFPRCYYRCTHRNVQGCLATKQVQRSESDQNIFEVTYRGRHTCTSISAPNKPTKKIQRQPSLKLKHSPEDEILFDFGQDFNLKTEDLDLNLDLDDVFPTFCFPSPGSEIVEENVLLYESVMETAFSGAGGLSPATSEGNYFGSVGGVHRIQSSDQSDLTDIISAPTSVTNSPIGSWDFSLQNVDFDPNIPFDNPEFFS